MRYNQSIQNYPWVSSTTVGEVICISTKQGNSGTQAYITGLFKKPKGILESRNSSVRDLHWVDFWNGLDVSVDIIAAFIEC